jgi:hypothetical protein
MGRESKYLGKRGVKIHWIGSKNSMGRWSKYHG